MRSILPLLLLSSLQIITCDIEFAKILSPYNQQHVFSSTLQWTSIQPGKRLPENSVIGAVATDTEDNTAESEGKAFFCRINNQGMWLLGQVKTTGKDANTCVAFMHDQIYRKTVFDILENGDNGAKLSWMRWDKFHAPPSGTVSLVLSGDNYNYVARKAIPDSKDGYSHQLGRLDPDGLGKLTVINDNRVESFEDGEVLKETEPFSYQLKDVKFNRFRERINKTPVVLGRATLKNEDASDKDISRVDTAIAYK